MSDEDTVDRLREILVEQYGGFRCSHCSRTIIPPSDLPISNGLVMCPFCYVWLMIPDQLREQTK